MDTLDPGRDPAGLQLAISPNGLIHLTDPARPFEAGATLCGTRMKPRRDGPDWATHEAVDPLAAFDACPNPCSKCSGHADSYQRPVAA